MLQLIMAQASVDRSPNVEGFLLELSAKDRVIGELNAEIVELKKALEVGRQNYLKLKGEKKQDWGGEWERCGCDVG